MEKPYPQNQETALIARARSGSRDAFSELVHRHSQQIYGVSLRMLKNHEDAEDNVQNVLCKAYHNIRQFEGNSRFSTWLVRIAINEALMKLRKTQSDRAAKSAEVFRPDSDEPMIPEVEDQRPNPERAYIAKDLTAKAFYGLHPALRDTFILHKAEGWTNRELACAMGITVETVKSRIFRARVRMRNQLRSLSEEPAAPAAAAF
ncbi:MAG TPA: sigma-70 family RNA polymerase sigma factor [Candidatus Acidoferrum sp.]|nr:sigma-70 family RNA polymerase sigma factor [Candidatus Acidoferrum sp.]